MKRIIQIWAALTVLLAPAGADAETLQTGISSQHIEIKTNFTGTSILVFGAIGHDQRPSEPYDLVITMRGPDEAIIVRRKTRAAGFWVNGDALRFENVPEFYAVLSTRPLAEVASRAVLDEHGIGFDSLRMTLNPLSGPQPEEDVRAFRAALIETARRRHCYFSDTSGVKFIGSILFRATVNLPSHVSTGDYTISTFLFRGGKVLNANTGVVTIDKVGAGQFLSSAAAHEPLTYAIASVAFAVLAGLGASIFFGRH